MAKIAYKKDGLAIYYPDKHNDIKIEMEGRYYLEVASINFSHLKKVVKKIEDSKGD